MGAEGGEKVLIRLYERMALIRAFETLMEERARAGELWGTFHSSVGQEAAAVGVCAAIGREDLLVSNHRGHGHFIAKGGEVRTLAAELYGLPDGCCGGRGGTQHLYGPEFGFAGSNGITGGGIPIATGLAQAQKMLGTGRIVVCMFGDGASNQGVFHESLNMAAIWRLPVLYVCENNGWAMSTPTSEVTAGSSIAARGAAYGIPYARVDGNDVEAVLRAASEAAARVRSGEGPYLLECLTWRIRGHSRSDDNFYRDKAAEKAWADRDPLRIAAGRLVASGAASDSEIKAIEERARGEVMRAVEACRSARRPDGSSAASKLYATPIEPSEPDPSVEPLKEGEFEEKYYWEAIREALCEEMDRDERVYLFGEDCAEYGGCFKVTRGMLERYGKSRVINTPISEASIVGLAAGAAMGGVRPVTEIMFMDFILLAFDQIANHAAKFHYMYDGRVRVPLVIRTPAGGYRGYGATHSQSLESRLLGIPGLKVVAPSTPRDAKGLLKTALRGGDPVIFVEHKGLYGTRGPVPKREETIPLGRARVARTGKDVTVASYSYGYILSLKAAEALQPEGISCEVVDLRSLVPMDAATVAKSASRTQKLVIVEEGHLTGGIGAELAARVQEMAFGYLDAPIRRVAAADFPIPAGRELERAILPSVESIVSAVRELTCG